MTKRAALRFPDRKISETFLDFASPTMNDLPSEAAEHRARQALQVSFTVWNAVIFADVLNDHGSLLSGYKVNRFNWLEVSSGLSWESDG
jgi:hypothetical protein